MRLLGACTGILLTGALMLPAAGVYLHSATARQSTTASDTGWDLCPNHVVHTRVLPES